MRVLLIVAFVSVSIFEYLHAFPPHLGGRSFEQELDIILRDSGSGEERVLQKRGAASGVDTVTAYDSNGYAVEMTVEEACLHSHNELRKLHEDTPPLKYDKDLADSSAKWALHLAEISQLEHTDPKGKYGENIYYKALMSDIGSPDQPPVVSPAHAVYSWYSESWMPGSYEQPYDYGREGIEQSGTGHFTQVVWKNSEKVGCGVATVEEPNPTNPAFMMQKTFVVAQYVGPGNYMGEYLDNVRPMQSGASRPESAADIEPVNGCIDYGPNCGAYSGFCSMMGDVCGCTCSDQ